MFCFVIRTFILLSQCFVLLPLSRYFRVKSSILRFCFIRKTNNACCFSNVLSLSFLFDVQHYMVLFCYKINYHAFPEMLTRLITFVILLSWFSACMFIAASHTSTRLYHVAVGFKCILFPFEKSPHPSVCCYG